MHLKFLNMAKDMMSIWVANDKIASVPAIISSNILKGVENNISMLGRGIPSSAARLPRTIQLRENERRLNVSYGSCILVLYA